MIDQHPITSPSQELVRKWIEDWAGGQMKGPVTEDQLVVASQAARWGADQELEACSEWLLNSAPWTVDPNERPEWVQTLKRCRRPKPPSLAEEAMEQLQAMEQAGALDCNIDAIRAALERLKELEKGNE